MKLFVKTLSLGFIIFVLSSCVVTKEYERAVSTNSISAYENYQEKFPENKFKQDVNQRLHVLYDEQTWRQSLSRNSINSFENYISKFPSGKYVQDARKEISKIEKQNEINSAWNKSKIGNTIEGYETFINLYPKSKYVFDAKSKIRTLKEERTWVVAQNLNTIRSYSQYLQSYPYGKYKYPANSKISKLEEEKYVLPIWKIAQSKNTYIAYSDFLNQYSNSSYAVLAKKRMTKIDETDWAIASRKNTINSYKEYNKKYPNGEFADISEKKIIDLEVDKIFRGDFGELPPMSKSSLKRPSNIVEIYNNTKYTLTVRYSGVESKKIVLSPRQRKSTTLRVGNYRVTASVDASNVTNYAGKENLTGGDYSSEYYIQTQTYRTWR